MNPYAIRKLIRHLRKLPEDFRWDFNLVYKKSPNYPPLTSDDLKACGCAIGLAYHTKMIPYPSGEDIATALGISQSTTMQIFFLFNDDHTPKTVFPSPSDISKRLEALLTPQG